MKNFLAQKNYGHEKILGAINFGCNQFWVQSILGCEKNFWRKIILSAIHIWGVKKLIGSEKKVSEINLGFKEILYSKLFWIQQFFVQKEFATQKISECEWMNGYNFQQTSKEN